MVAFDIVGEEAHTALEGHHSGTDRHQLDLLIGQLAGTALQEALGVCVIKLKIQRNLGKANENLISFLEKNKIPIASVRNGGDTR